MNHFTNPNYTTNHFDNFSEEEKRKYATYLFDCADCGQRTCVDAGGGVLNPCLKQERADAHCSNSMFVTTVIGGFADTPRSLTSIAGTPARENAWQPTQVA